MKKFLLISLLGLLPCLAVFSQDVLFSYTVNNNDPTNSIVSVFAQFDGSGNSNAAGYTVVFYYNAGEATTATGNVDFTPTTNLGWATAGNTTYSNAAQNNPNVPITHTNRIEIGVIDGNVDGAGNGGTNFTTTPTLLLTITFNKNIGTPMQGGDVYIGATGDTDPAIVYFDNFFGGYNVAITGMREALLPINLVSFTAQKYNERSSLIEWSTSSEINSSHFNVMRSLDNKTWTIIGEVEAQGNSQIIQNYEFIDQNVYNGVDSRLTAYYRLQAVDTDNRTKLTSIKTVVFTGTGTSTGRDIVVYPNPSSEGLQVEWDGSHSDQPTQLEFFDTHGKLVYSTDVDENASQQYIDFDDTTIIPGLYILRIMSGDQPIDFKQIVVDQR